VGVVDPLNHQAEAVVAEAPTTNAKRATPAEAEALWRSWTQHGDSRARDRLVFLYTPMVRYLANRKLCELPAYLELEDLISCGLIALIGAIDRFDPAKGATFEQYAWTRVAGAIVDELRRQNRTSRSSRKLSHQVDRVRESWIATHGRTPTEGELAGALEISVSELRARQIELERAKLVPLNAPARASDDSTPVEIGDTIEAPEERANPELTALSREKAAVLKEAIASLSDRERTILTLLHVHHLQGAEIGRIVGVSESRVSQMLAAIRTKLKAELDDYDDVGLDAAA
jgi:RNA polymerase sigma factor for flagellar operon FliA